MKIREVAPKPAQFQKMQREDRRILERAAHQAVDRRIRNAQQRTRRAISSAGLGKLGNAVGVTSSYTKGKRAGPNAWGAIYAKGGDNSLAGGALDAYSRGTTIRPLKGQWLWYQTPALARKIKIGTGLYRLTPERYNMMGQPLGPLKFRRISTNFAILYADGKFRVNPKGRAKLAGPRAPHAQRRNRVTVFLGIKNTRRGKRFDQTKITEGESALVGATIAAIMRYEERRR